MIILTIRTDKKEAEIGLFDNANQLTYVTWEAHRQLAETLHKKIKEMLNGQKLDCNHVQAIVAYEGPGSFTGLRIGLSVANALAYSNGVPIVGTTGEDWIEKGIELVLQGDGKKLIVPEYGAEANITTPKK